VEELIELFRYRELLGLLIANEIKTRYRRSVLGVGWTLLNPLLTMLVMTFAFSSLFRDAINNYPLYVLSGLLLWNFFSQTSTAAMNSLVWGGALLKRVYIPRTIFAAAAVGGGLVNLMVGLAPLTAIMLVTGQPFRPALLFVPVAIGLAGLFVLGLALGLSTLAVYFVDIVEIFHVLVLAWFYLTPVMYPAGIIPPELAPYLKLNPMHYYIQLFRRPLYEGAWPEPWAVLVAAAAALASLGLGWWFFTSRADDFGYRL
jgi:ABC-type polysaccharide/polyol phosphate export permease